MNARSILFGRSFVVVLGAGHGSMYARPGCNVVGCTCLR